MEKTVPWVGWNPLFTAKGGKRKSKTRKKGQNRRCRQVGKGNSVKEGGNHLTTTDRCRTPSRQGLKTQTSMETFPKLEPQKKEYQKMANTKEESNKLSRYLGGRISSAQCFRPRTRTPRPVQREHQKG